MKVGIYISINFNDKGLVNNGNCFRYYIILIKGNIMKNIFIQELIFMLYDMK